MGWQHKPGTQEALVPLRLHTFASARAAVVRPYAPGLRGPARLSGALPLGARPAGGASLVQLPGGRLVTGLTLTAFAHHLLAASALRLPSPDSLHGAEGAAPVRPGSPPPRQPAALHRRWKLCWLPPTSLSHSDGLGHSRAPATTGTAVCATSVSAARPPSSPMRSITGPRKCGAREAS